MKRLFAAEAIILCIPSVAVLAITLPEVWVTTVWRLMDSPGKWNALQTFSEPLFWTAGALALYVAGTLAVATVSRRLYRCRAISWLGLILWATSAAALYGHLGRVVTSIVIVPLMVLVIHAVAIQCLWRRRGQASPARLA